VAQSGPEHWFLLDALGTTLGLTSNAGALTDTFLYEAFGTSLGRTGTTVTSYQYVGGYGYWNEPNVGLEQVWWRWYGLGAGRFVSRDPIGAVSRYQYVGNEPMVAVDPSGMQGSGIVIPILVNRKGDPGFSPPIIIIPGAHQSNLAECLADCDRRATQVRINENLGALGVGILSGGVGAILGPALLAGDAAAAAGSEGAAAAAAAKAAADQTSTLIGLGTGTAGFGIGVFAAKCLRVVADPSSPDINFDQADCYAKCYEEVIKQSMKHPIRIKTPFR
jgi:RHS repeat-associated protein